jgi:hypothetical protein
VIEVPQDQTVDFRTVGVYETFSGPDSIPHRPTAWRCIEMQGTAQSIIVPLVEAAKVLPGQPLLPRCLRGRSSTISNALPQKGARPRT